MALVQKFKSGDQVKDSDIFSTSVDASGLNDKYCGIYFLIKETEASKTVVYVGQSTCVMQRLRTHYGSSNIDFNSYSILECAECDLDRLETYFILKYLPRYNKKVSSKGLIYIGNTGNSDHRNIQVTMHEINGKVYLNPATMNGIKLRQSWDTLKVPQETELVF